MLRYPDIQTVRDQLPPTRRLSYGIAGGGALLVAGFFLGQPLLLLAGLLLLGVSILPELWQYFALSGVSVQRTLGAQRVLIGEEVLLTLRVENRKLLPVPRLDIEDDVPLDGLALRGARQEISERATRALLVNTFSLWALQRITRRYRVRGLARGVYTFGPLRLVGGDPFGMLTRERIQGERAELLVYPLTVPLDWLGVTPRDLFGAQYAVRLLEDPLSSVGVRDYLPGDDPRRIHWKATARLGRLQSRVYESSARRALALFLDVRTSAQPALTGYDPSLVELMVCAAASIASWADQQGDAFGLYANGTLVEDKAPRLAANVPDALGRRRKHSSNHADARRLSYIRIKPSAGTHQFVHVQETLARFVPFFTASVADMLLHDATHLSAGATIVVVCTRYSLDTASRAVLRHLQASGHSVAVLLAGDAGGTEDPRETVAAERTVTSGDLPTVLLGDAETWITLVEEALATRSIGMCAADGPHSPDDGDEGERAPSDNRWEARTIPPAWRLETHP